MLAVLDVEIARGIFGIGGHLPSENTRVKVRRAFYVGRAQVSPAQRAMDAGDSDPRILLYLPDAESRAGRILHHRHAARIHYVESWGKNFAAQLFRFCSSRVSAVNFDVNHPVRRDAVRALVGAQRASGSGMAALKLEHGVKAVGAHRIVVGFPAEKCAVETLGGGLVGGVEFNPAEGAGGMIIDICHKRFVIAAKVYTNSNHHQAITLPPPSCLALSNARLAATISSIATPIALYTVISSSLRRPGFRPRATAPSVVPAETPKPASSLHPTGAG